MSARLLRIVKGAKWANHILKPPLGQTVNGQQILNFNHMEDPS
jgi:hypothetical protein